MIPKSNVIDIIKLVIVGKFVLETGKLFRFSEATNAASNLKLPRPEAFSQAATNLKLPEAAANLRWHGAISVAMLCATYTYNRNRDNDRSLKET